MQREDRDYWLAKIKEARERAPVTRIPTFFSRIREQSILLGIIPNTEKAKT